MGSDDIDDDDYDGGNKTWINLMKGGCIMCLFVEGTIGVFCDTPRLYPVHLSFLQIAIALSILIVSFLRMAIGRRGYSLLFLAAYLVSVMKLNVTEQYLDDSHDLIRWMFLLSAFCTRFDQAGRIYVVYLGILYLMDAREKDHQSYVVRGDAIQLNLEIDAYNDMDSYCWKIVYEIASHPTFGPWLSLSMYVSEWMLAVSALMWSLLPVPFSEMILKISIMCTSILIIGMFSVMRLGLFAPVLLFFHVAAWIVVSERRESVRASFSETTLGRKSFLLILFIVGIQYLHTYVGDITGLRSSFAVYTSDSMTEVSGRTVIFISSKCSTLQDSTSRIVDDDVCVYVTRAAWTQ